MHIYLKNKKLYFNKYKVNCAIGKSGIKKNKKEGDLATPRGKFSFVSVFYRKDRVKIRKCVLKKVAIKKNMGWCDDIKSDDYNKAVKLPSKFGAEKLYLKKNIYDVVLVIKYNIKPTITKKGSAIFLHIATKNYSPTKGCLAISKKHMMLLLNLLNKKTKIHIF